MRRFLFFIDSVNTWIGKAFSWSILTLTIVIGYSVIARYAFRRPLDWSVDYTYILYGVFIMMGGAYTLARNAHVRGDMIYRSLPVRVQAILDLVLYILFFLPGVLALIFSGFGFAGDAWLIQEKSSVTTIGTPIYPFKTIIPVAAFLLLMQGIAEMIRCSQAIKTGVWPQRLSDVEETESKLAKETQL